MEYSNDVYASNNAMVMGSGTMGVKLARDVEVPRVSHEMGVVQKMLAENLELANTVAQRLHAVLRPSSPEKNAGEGGVPRPVTSPLASDLEAFRSQLAQLASVQRDILDRLEV